MCRCLINQHRRHDSVIDPTDHDAYRLDEARAVHRSLTEYQPTPTYSLPTLAERSDVGRILVKDESYRFGLNAFKALGASYAVYRLLTSREHPVGESWPPPHRFYSGLDVALPHSFTLCTATDGNHGRGVAWVARKLNQRAVIYMPGNTVSARIAAIQDEGADVHVIGGSYDDAVRRCAEQAEEHGWTIISDTSWPGYDLIPRWIQAGYLTMFAEIDEQTDAGIDAVLVPGGVGALAAAAAWYYRVIKQDGAVKLVSVEPLAADCLYRSAAGDDGHPVAVHGEPDTIMAGLNCGTPSQVAWPLIRDAFDAFVAIPDRYAVEAMRAAYYPADSDPRIISGESGAASMGAWLALGREEALAECRSGLDLDRDATILLLNTEGDTDPEGFRRAVAF